MFIMHDANVLGFDLNLLVAFDALASELHVTRAAKRIGLSQPAMSHALRRLRVALDDELFVRTPHGLLPTPRADTLAAVVRRSLVAVGAALAPPCAFDPMTLRRTFVVSAPDYTEIVLLPALLERLRREAPLVILRVRPASARPDVDLDDLSLDLAFRPLGSSSPRFVTQKLFSDDFVTVARRDHPTVKRRLTLQQFVTLDHIQISVRGAPGGPVEDALAKLGRRRRIALYVPHFLSAPMIVSTSDLILTLVRRIADRMAPLLNLRVFPTPVPLPRFSVHQLWHEHRHADPAHVWFRGVVADVARML